MKVVLASSNNPLINQRTLKISIKETTSCSVEQASGRPKRSTAGSWLDGPSNRKSEDFMTAKSQIKSNVQKQALMIESQGIDITKAFMTTAKQQVYEDTIQEVNNPHGLFEVKAMRASLKHALHMKPRRQAILKSIEAEINNL
jgi:hypothetical protein